MAHPLRVLDGNVIAGVRDNSAAFYNPGALGFIEEPDISVSGNLYGYRYFKLQNGMGPDVDVFTGGYLLYPQMLSSVFKIGNEDPWYINFNWLTRNNAFKIINERYEQDYDVIPTLNGIEHFSGSLDYFQELSEQWVGIGTGRKIGENWSVGGSIFGTYRWQLNRFEQVAEAYPKTNFVTLPNGDLHQWYVSSTTAMQLVQFENFQIIAKAGIAFEKDRWKLGLTVTAPSINLNTSLLELGYVTRDQRQKNLGIPYDIDETFDKGLFDYRASDKQKNLATNHKKPLSVGFGVERELVKGRVMFACEYFFPIETYAVIRGEQRPDLINPPFLQPLLDRPNYMTIYEQNKAVFNWGLSYEHDLDNGVSIHGGFRTDGSYHEPDYSEEWEGAMDLLPLPIDFLHLNAGFSMPTKAGEFTLALHYANGFTDDTEPILNMVDVIDHNEETGENMRGTQPTETELTHFQINMIIGYTYLF